MTADVLYVNGRDGGELLRLSLRSLAKYGKGVGRVVVCGYCPPWLSKSVTAVPVEDVTEGGYKHINILNCIKVAIERGAVKGDFQLSSNDHFFGAPTDISKLPFFVRPGVLLSYEAATRRNGGTPSMYNASLAATKRLLDAHGLDTRLFNGHVNTWLDADDLPAVMKLVESADPYDRENYGFEPTCLFQSVRMARDPFLVTIREDVKLYDLDPAQMSGPYSVGEWEGLANALQAYLKTGFGAPCAYEQGAAKVPRKRRGA